MQSRPVVHAVIRSANDAIYSSMSLVDESGLQSVFIVAMSFMICAKLLHIAYSPTASVLLK